MQDLKNNDDNKRTGQNRVEGHPLDQQLRSLLLDAEVTPGPDLMDKMFAQLDLTNHKEVAPQAEKEAEAGADANIAIKEGYKVPVIEMSTKLKGAGRRRLSYAAAIAGILIVLSFGLKELINKEDAIQPPAGLIAVANTENSAAKTNEELEVKDPATKLNTATGTNTTNNIAAISSQQAVLMTEKVKVNRVGNSKSNNPSTTVHPSSRLAKLPAVAKNRQLAAVKVPVPALTMPGTATKTKGNIDLQQPPATGAQLARVNKQNTTTTSIAVQQSGVAQQTNQAALAAGQVAKTDTMPLKATGRTEQLALFNDADLNAVRQVAQNPTVVTSSIELDKVAGTPYNQTALTGDAKSNNAPRNRRRGGGFFRGLVQKISNSARAISEEVVTQDEDKTVINVGIVAITTYR